MFFFLSWWKKALICRTSESNACSAELLTPRTAAPPGLIILSQATDVVLLRGYRDWILLHIGDLAASELIQDTSFVCGFTATGSTETILISLTYVWILVSKKLASLSKAPSSRISLSFCFGLLSTFLSIIYNSCCDYMGSENPNLVMSFPLNVTY